MKEFTLLFERLLRRLETKVLEVRLCTDLIAQLRAQVAVRAPYVLNNKTAAMVDMTNSKGPRRLGPNR